MKKLFSAVAAPFILANLAVSSCAYPTETVTQGGSEASISFQGFPEGAQVVVDGQPAGNVGQYDGRAQKLAVPTGTHRVEVIQAGRVMLDRKVYVGRNSTLTISPE
ncbi:hypothetical protein [Henriciella sp.]|jgi:hypothetical protein|uniref:hypothetical protein n=1 Tax=Henriciella sp. TaxID=1968823 RepID=UPI000C62855B|nr:hypothetical protein [Henriciella sp.]MAN73641.1 hypothetical protein [Henriciella sp.]MAZ25454.1 hypothetical protein [Cytophagaceae bacterium]|tara:strand:+ start:410 stop:727 length:318 start_codon:yes stop_codon:yes gene_type:complete